MGKILRNREFDLLEYIRDEVGIPEVDTTVFNENGEATDPAHEESVRALAAHEAATNEIQITDNPNIWFEIIEQPTSTVKKFRFVSELLSNREDQGKPLKEKLILITNKNDGTIYGQNGRRNSYQKIKIHSGNFRGTALITISAVETDDDFSIHPHVIVGGENVSEGPIFVKRIEIEQESTVVDIRVAIVSTKREDSSETLDLIQEAHEDFGLDDQRLKYEPCHQRYNLNAVKLRFQVKFLEGINGYLLKPKISNQIRNNYL